MAKYSAVLARTLSTSASVGTVGSSATTRRGRIIDIVIGVEGTPGDTALKTIVQRYTAAGTSTAVTPNPLDFADVASNTAAGQNHTVEPTYTSNVVLLAVSQNQRSTVRWFAAPGEELSWPATSASGLGFQTPTAPALAGTISVVFDE